MTWPTPTRAWSLAASVAAAVDAARSTLESVSTVHTYLPILVARQAREELMAAGQAEGRIAKTVSELLFVCADPADQPIEVVRDVRDDIQARVTTLLRDLNI